MKAIAKQGWVKADRILIISCLILWVLLTAGILAKEIPATGALDELYTDRPITIRPKGLVDEHKLAPDGAFSLVVDDESPGFTIESGAWILGQTGNFYGYYKHYISGPGTGAAQVAWLAEGLPPGNYTVEFWVNNGNYASDAHYMAEHQDGISSPIGNQYYVGDGWQPLGTYNFNGTGRILLNDYWTGTGDYLIADAIRFTLNGTAEPPTQDVITPHISLIIDDAGSGNPNQVGSVTYNMLQLPCDLTVAVLPLLTYTTEVANAAYQKGYEVILHQPMQPISYPSVHPGPGAIFSSMTDAEVINVVQSNLDQVPHVVGMNNHMGSQITQETHKMELVISELLSRGMFYIDSRTISTSVAYDVGQAAGILTGERDVFIDGNSVAEVKANILQLAREALYAPHVAHIAIGHVRTYTIQAIGEVLPDLESMGVEIWRVSKSITQVVESDFQPAGAEFHTTGTWSVYSNDLLSKELHHGNAYRIVNPGSSPGNACTFIPNLPVEGYYNVYTGCSGDANNCTDIRVQINYLGSQTEKTLNQAYRPNFWYYLGRYPFAAGTSASVVLDDTSCTGTTGNFLADSVKFVFYSPPKTKTRNWFLY